LDDYKMMVNAYKEAGGEDVFSDSEVAHVVLERDNVLGSHEVEGLEVNIKKREKGRVQVEIEVAAAAVIKNPVHMCFGVLPEKGLQIIDMEVNIGRGAEIEVLADCIFPNASEVKHIMEAEINLAENSKYTYRENHYHGEEGGVEVQAEAEIMAAPNSYFYSVFSLLQGRAGKISFDYQADLDAHSTLEMLARIRGNNEDEITIREAGVLRGKGARGILDSKIALQDKASGEILNELTACASNAQGHVDCTEVIKDEATARAVPIVNVEHPEAKITHEAAIGSVDDTKLQSLMSRGLNEEEATEVIVQGMLKG